MTRLRLATWNVNSLRARLERVGEWMRQVEPDILCLQETKLADAAFPVEWFSARGYESAHHGAGQWNGVAVVSRVGLGDVERTMGPGTETLSESRFVAATCGPLRVASVYVPNGRSLDSEHYLTKLAWLRQLAGLAAFERERGMSLALCGDFNVAPDDRDVWDPRAFEGATHVSEPEREAIRALEAEGLVDAFRVLYDQSGLFSWWDYRGGAFHQHRGMRIDLVLVSASLRDRVRWAVVDRNARKGGKENQPSDHAPVVVDLEV
jgi:exodeoxyribonuclease-3